MKNFIADEYFVSNIEKVDSVTLLRKDKVMTGVSWSVRFQQAISTWPCNNDLGSAAAAQVLYQLFVQLNIWEKLSFKIMFLYFEK